MTEEWERMRLLEDRWAKECEEWQAISRELVSKANGKTVVAFDVTQEQRQRMAERGEKLVGDDPVACQLLGITSLRMIEGVRTEPPSQAPDTERPADVKFVWDTSPKPYDEVAAKMKVDAESIRKNLRKADREARADAKQSLRDFASLLGNSSGEVSVRRALDTVLAQLEALEKVEEVARRVLARMDSDSGPDSYGIADLREPLEACEEAQVWKL